MTSSSEFDSFVRSTVSRNFPFAADKEGVWPCIWAGEDVEEAEEAEATRSATTLACSW